MAPPTEIERDLRQLEAELRQLEAEYTMFFAGRSPRPPWQTRKRVEALVKRYDRVHIQSNTERFRFATLQARFATFVDLWDRSLRAREEGRAGPLTPAPRSSETVDRGSADRVLLAASFKDPSTDMDNLRRLHRAVTEGRQLVGEAELPFERFVALVNERVGKLRSAGGEVAVQVALKNGKVRLTARAVPE